MMDAKIHLLDEHTANQIAAGEVVERPASVVKELVENALDAQATFIEVEIVQGGIELIRVTDNGSGMSQADAELAILRHATSKIRTAEDLDHVLTLGFRGEALPSIASVSQFSLLTRLVGQDVGCRIEAAGGTAPEVSPAGTAVGTTVLVEALFFNTPARRKFLKSPQAEARQVHDTVGRLALTRPDVQFVLINGGKTVLSTPGTGRLQDAIGGLYGQPVQAETVPVAFEYEAVQVCGFVGKPTLLRGNRQWQTIIVNGRVIASRSLQRAVDQAYESLIPRQGFPFAVLAITIDTQQVDVNVHPQKSEVRFSNEQQLFRAVYHAVRTALEQGGTLGVKGGGASALVPPAEAIAAPLTVRPLYAREGPAVSAWSPAAASLPSFVAESQPDDGRSRFVPQSEVSWAQTARQAAAPIERPLDETRVAALFQAEISGAAPIWPVGQVDKAFIIAQSDSAMYVIDQHAAHERILFDKLAARLENMAVQPLLLPISLAVTYAEASLAEEQQALLASLGFEITPCGPAQVSVAAAPVDLPETAIEPVVREMLSFLVEEKTPSALSLRQKFLFSSACHAAIRAGELLSMRQMKDLVQQLFATKFPYTCPHGRPVTVRFEAAEIGRWFKRGS